MVIVARLHTLWHTQYNLVQIKFHSLPREVTLVLEKKNV